MDLEGHIGLWGVDGLAGTPRDTGACFGAEGKIDVHLPAEKVDLNGKESLCNGSNLSGSRGAPSPEGPLHMHFWDGDQEFHHGISF